MIELKRKDKNATVDSCFNLVGSLQHGVAAKEYDNSREGQLYTK